MPRCRGSVPFTLYGAESPEGPSVRLSDEDAEALGYRALLEGGTINGGCTCEPAPDALLCSDGCSVWRPTRVLCDDGKYLYSWLNTESSCTASCGEGSCVPTIPESPVMPLTTMDDEDAEAYFGMPVSTLLATDYSGGCGCTDAYVPPECPPACDCDDVTHAWDFTVAADEFTEASAYNGNYHIVKGGTPDPCVGCCWSGGADFQLVWSSNLWQITTPFGHYEAIGTPCDGPTITLGLVSGGIDGSPPFITFTIP